MDVNKKNIGILTLPLSNNYGGILQAVALYTFLEEIGYTPYQIRLQQTEKKKDILKNIFAKNIFSFIWDPKNLAKKYKQDIKLRRFIDEFFTRKTSKIYSQKELQTKTIFLDAFVVGSDQVWRHSYTHSYYKNYFFDFVSDKTPKIAYSASFGLDQWEGDDNTETEIATLLQRFSFISVREKSAVAYCNNLIKVDKVEHVLDPTFLVDKKFYIDLMSKENRKNKIEIFNYVLDQKTEKQEIVNIISRILSFKIETIDLYQESFKPRSSIAEWLSNIYNAKFIVTDSFHGMVFSIIFNKQFIVIANKDRGYSRFYSLLNELNLTDRIIDDSITKNEDGIDEMVRREIDYQSVNNKLKELIKSSQNFLIKSLSNV